MYFVQTDPPEGPVKIGFTTRKVDIRVSEGQTFSHTKLHILAETLGTLADEAQLHKRFKHLRVHGEWFTYGEPIQDLVQFLQDGGSLQSWLA